MFDKTCAASGGTKLLIMDGWRWYTKGNDGWLTKMEPRCLELAADVWEVHAAAHAQFLRWMGRGAHVQR